jgi:hypothetical protein
MGSTYGTFTDPVVLVSGNFRYVFRYYARGGKESPVWNKSRFEMPARIELSIYNRDGVLLFTAPIAVPAFASLSAGCLAGDKLQGCADVAPVDETALKAYGIDPAKQ